jgi:hypothetical protein
MSEMKPSSQPADPERLLRERRTELRFPCHLLASCRPEGEGTGYQWTAKVRDISSKGIGLYLPNEFPRSCVLNVNLYDDAGQIRLRNQARVVFVRPDGGGWVHGCQFLQRLDEKVLEELTGGTRFSERASSDST